MSADQITGRVGPTMFTPEQVRSKMVCTRCDFLKHNLIRSGRDPIWECLCLHPRAWDSGPQPERSREIHSLNGAKDRVIGELPDTPRWCPVVRERNGTVVSEGDLLVREAARRNARLAAAGGVFSTADEHPPGVKFLPGMNLGGVTTERKVMSAVQAKFRCNLNKGYSDADKITKIVLSPVQPTYDGKGGMVISPENKQFWDATPSGEISLFVKNEAAAKCFVEGHEYLVTFTPAEEAARAVGEHQV